MVVLFALFSLFQGQAQNEVKTGKNTSPVFAISSNILYDATTSMNLGMEWKVANRFTLKLPVTYNPWTFNDNKKFKFILVQPELRWWLCEPFSGHFFGLHAHYASFNVGGVGFNRMKPYRYEGYLYGAGISYGYQIYLAPRWNLELNIGGGFVHVDYDKYNCEKCGDLLGHGKKNYFTPTQAGISLIYILK
ncbi:MAG: DUF3575 domain-containing protein [Candidatus Azobacteroides sp.]|nr:DUF3575 domain-containing protein [Candidatus Azobacteroides sp.]